MKDVVIVSAVRSPMGRAHKGQFVWTRADDLCADVVRAALAKVPSLDPAEVEDLLVGCAMPEGEQGMNVARNIGFLAGLPLSTAAVTVNRFCSSSLVTAMMAVQAIAADCGDVQISAGVESMSHVPMGGFNPSLNKKLMDGKLPDAYIAMGTTAELLADKYKISRAEQDEFACESHQKAAAAIEKKIFANEIAPCHAVQKDGSVVQATKDEGPRPDSTVAALGALKPAFKDGGSVTAGNSSPLTDGASATVLMCGAKAKSLNLKPLARVISMAVSGCDPQYMGLGPVQAVQKALKRASLTLNQIDLIELNEAFAVQSLAVIKELQLDRKKLNVHGGAIALGHPLGATGGRMLATLVNALSVHNKRYGLATMCVGGGQGAAMIVERL